LYFTFEAINKRAPGNCNAVAQLQEPIKGPARFEWNKTPPAPELPEEIVRKTTEKYLLAKRILTSESN
jgi:hypothetical protein